MTIKIYKDTIKIDTFGYVELTDSVQNNELINTFFKYRFRLPIITNTTTITKTIVQKKKNEWFIGGGLEGNKDVLVNQINTSLLLKTKKDKLYQIKIGFDKNSNTWFGLGTYIKL